MLAEMVHRWRILDQPGLAQASYIDRVGSNFFPLHKRIHFWWGGAGLGWAINSVDLIEVKNTTKQVS